MPRTGVFMGALVLVTCTPSVLRLPDGLLSAPASTS